MMVINSMYSWKLLVIFILFDTICSAQKTLHIVTVDSKVIWTGTKVVGFHQGTVKIKEGNVTMKDQKLVGGYFIIDMNSITCTDIPDSEPVPKRRLENHLKGADFFNVVEFLQQNLKLGKCALIPTIRQDI